MKRHLENFSVQGLAIAACGSQGRMAASPQDVTCLACRGTKIFKETIKAQEANKSPTPAGK